MHYYQRLREKKCLPGKCKDNWQRSPGVFGGSSTEAEPGRGIQKCSARRPGGSRDNARKEQHESALFEEKKRAGFATLRPPKMNINEAISSVSNRTNERCFPRGA